MVCLFVNNDRKQKKTRKYKAQPAKTVKRTTEVPLNESGEQSTRQKQSLADSKLHLPYV